MTAGAGTSAAAGYGGGSRGRGAARDGRAGSARGGEEA